MSIEHHKLTQVQSSRMTGGLKTNPVADSVPASPKQIVNTAAWLEQQRRIRLSSIQDVLVFVLSIYNAAAQSLPNPDDLLELIDTLYTQKYPGTTENLTNPRSQAYPIVLNAIEPLLNRSPLEVLYSTPVNNSNCDSKKVAILLPDIHTDPQERLDHYNFLTNAFTSNQIQFSSGFSEGQVNGNEILPTIPKGYGDQDIKNFIYQNKLSPEQGFLYLIQGQVRRGSQGFAAFSPEQLTASEQMKGLMKDLISIACGAYPTLFPGSYNEQRTHYLRLLRSVSNDFERIGASQEFFTMFTIIMKQQLGQLKLPESQQRQIMTQAITLFLNSDQFTQESFLRIPIAIKEAQYDGLRDFYRQQRFELDIKRRNMNITEAFDKEKCGTRLMIIGSAHIDIRSSQDYSLIRLLEQKQIPVIVLGNRASKLQLS